MIIRKKTSDVTSLVPELHRVTVQGIMPTRYESAKVIRISVMFSHNFDSNIISVNIFQYTTVFARVKFSRRNVTQLNPLQSLALKVFLRCRGDVFFIHKYIHLQKNIFSIKKVSPFCQKIAVTVGISTKNWVTKLPPFCHPFSIINDLSVN